MTSFSDMVMDGSPALRDGGDLLVPLRIPWYRSLALSTFEDIGLTLDGAAVPRRAMRLEAGGRSCTLDELAERTEEFWYVQDTGYVRVPAPQSLGAVVEVAARLRQRIPYILVGPGQCMVKHTRQTRILEVRDA